MSYSAEELDFIQYKLDNNLDIAPGEIELDYSNPLARVVAFAWKNGFNYVDETESIPVAGFSSTETSLGSDKNGQYWQSNSLTDGGWESPAPTLMRMIESASFFSLVMGASVNELSSSSTLLSVPAFKDSWTDPWVYIKYGSNGTTTTPRFYFHDGVSLRNEVGTGSALTEDDAFHTYGVDKNNSTTMNFYRDGVITSSNVASVNDNGMSITPGHESVYLMSRNTLADAEGTKGKVYFAYIFNRQLTEEENLSLNRNPNQIFKPKVRDEIVYGVAGGTNANVSLTGQGSTLSQGSLSLSGDSNISLTGQGGTLGQGSLSVSASSTATLNGQQITASQGALSISSDSNAALTGQQIVSGQGSVTVSVGGSVNVSLTGQQLTAGQGALSLSGSSNINVTGQQLTSSQGAITVSIDADIAITGQGLVAGQGTLSVDIDGSATVVLTGQQMTIGQGTATVSASSNVSLTGQSVTAQQGSLVPGLSATVTLTGQQSTIGQGSLAFSISSIAYLSGQSLTSWQGAVQPVVPGIISTSGILINAIIEDRITLPKPTARTITPKKGI